MKVFHFLLIIGTVICIETSRADSLNLEDIEVKVRISGEIVSVDLNMLVSASRQQVWAVLTDFDQMASFVSNLKESKVVSTTGSEKIIFQRGSANYGLIDFPFESTREMQLTPYEKIQSHMLSGNMTKMEGTTSLVDADGKTKIIFHSDTIPGSWLPPIAGKIFVEHETREQFKEIRDEILKRKWASDDLNK